MPRCNFDFLALDQKFNDYSETLRDKGLTNALPRSKERVWLLPHPHRKFLWTNIYLVSFKNIYLENCHLGQLNILENCLPGQMSPGACAILTKNLEKRFLKCFYPVAHQHREIQVYSEVVFIIPAYNPKFWNPTYVIVVI